MENRPLGVRSLGIVALLSVISWARSSPSDQDQHRQPLIQAPGSGGPPRQSTILEFSPTIISPDPGRKVGSNIAAEMGSMRVKEHHRCLDIMGVNSAGYPILPKIVAAVIINPFLVIISMFLSIFGAGWHASVRVSSAATTTSRDPGTSFDPYHVTYALIKRWSSPSSSPR